MTEIQASQLFVEIAEAFKINYPVFDLERRHVGVLAFGTRIHQRKANEGTAVPRGRRYVGNSFRKFRYDQGRDVGSCAVAEVLKIWNVRGVVLA